MNEGRQEGILEQQRETVLQAQQLGLNEADIVKLTGLSQSEVRKIIGS
jgi:DNA-directed RNA polymerase specialized sigma24 family protein